MTRGGRIAGNHGSGNRSFLRYARVPLVLFILVLAPAVSAADITLSTPKSEYFFLAGDEAMIPLTIASTYGHDVTGTLKLAMVPVLGAARAGNASVRIREFSAFTDARTVTVPAGRSGAPGHFLLSVTFSYAEGGPRVTTLGEISIHFVTAPEDAGSGGRQLTGMDIPDPSAAAPPGPSPAGTPAGKGPDASLQANQMPQDASALREQMIQESNRSRKEEDTLSQYIFSDPLVAPLNQSLAAAGFNLENTVLTPESATSGNFILYYRSGIKGATISGSLQDTHVRSAVASSKGLLPLPDALRENATFRAYETLVAARGFFTSESLLNLTPGRTDIDLTFTGPGDRRVRLHAEVVNGTVTIVQGENPDNPLAFLAPFTTILLVVLLSAGVWFFARHRPDCGTIPPDPTPQPTENPGTIAIHLLDRAEEDAARGAYPEAYRKTGRALRVVLSHEIADGDEMTAGELEPFLGAMPERGRMIRRILDRSRTVGFGKDVPDEAELRGMILEVRELCKTSYQAEGPGKGA